MIHQAVGSEMVTKLKVSRSLHGASFTFSPHSPHAERPIHGSGGPSKGRHVYVSTVWVRRLELTTGKSQGPCQVLERHYFLVRMVAAWRYTVYEEPEDPPTSWLGLCNIINVTIG